MLPLHPVLFLLLLLLINTLSAAASGSITCSGPFPSITSPLSLHTQLVRPGCTAAAAAIDIDFALPLNGKSPPCPFSFTFTFTFPFISIVTPRAAQPKMPPIPKSAVKRCGATRAMGLISPNTPLPSLPLLPSPLDLVSLTP